jgi:hypothetical protein
MHAKLIIATAKALVLAALLLTATLPTSAGAQGDMDISVFYEELEPHGRWFEHSRYGYVWSPDVDEDWRPYSRGHWIYTDEHGWYWEAEEPWGWGPFHYGRWILDDEFGWVWIPGTEWGPAWVAWRYSDEYVGWAPLPPEAEWYEDRGLTFSATYYDAPHFAPLWVFCAPRYMVLPGLYRYALPRHRNHFALARTRWHTDYRSVNRRVFNAGFDVRHFERITRRPVVRVRLVTSNSPRERGFRDGDRRTLQTFRPRLAAGINPPRPPKLADPPRREFRRQDGDRPSVVRPGFTPQDRERGGISRERGIATPPGGGGPDKDDDNARRKDFRGPGDGQRKDFARPPQEQQFKQRPGEASGGPDDNRRKDFVRPPREEQFRRRPPGEASGGPPPDFKKQEFKQPQTGLQAPPGQGGGDPRARQRENRQPDAGHQPAPRQRVERGPPPQQQFRQQGGPPPQAAGGQPAPQRGSGGQGQGDARKGKRPDEKEGTIAR